jgi:hypothetical protein
VETSAVQAVCYDSVMGVMASPVHLLGTLRWHEVEADSDAVLHGRAGAGVCDCQQSSTAAQQALVSTHAVCFLFQLLTPTTVAAA